MTQPNNSKSSKTLKYLLYISLPLFAVADLLVLRKSYFWFDGLPGFYAVFGFVTCILTIIVCKTLGHYWLMVSEDYYDNERDSENDQKGGIAF